MWIAFVFPVIWRNHNCNHLWLDLEKPTFWARQLASCNSFKIIVKILLIVACSTWWSTAQCFIWIKEFKANENCWYTDIVHWCIGPHDTIYYVSWYIRYIFICYTCNSYCIVCGWVWENWFDAHVVFLPLNTTVNE